MLSSFAEGRLFGVRLGPKPARVLALHGWQRSHRDFVGLDRQSFGIVALDLPGFGATPPPDLPMGARDYAELCRPVLEDMAQEAGRTVVLLGHSFGGRVALCLADLAPDRVLGLVLTGTPFGLNRSDGKVGSPFGYRMIRAARKWHLVSEAVLESARTRYGSTDYRNAQGVMREVLVRTVGESYGDELARLSLPLHLVWARDDTEARLDQAEAAAGIARKAQLRVLDGESHMLVLTPAGQSALSAEIGALLEADSCGSPSVDLATEKR